MEEDGISVVLSLKDEFTSGIEVIKSSVEGLSEAFEGVTSYAKLAGIAVVGALGLMAREVLSTSEELVHLSEVTGIGTERLQELGLAAQTHGSSLEGMAAGMRRLSLIAVQASEGSAKAAASFQKLGISVFDVNGNMKDTGTLFNEVANGFSHVEGSVEKSALAVQLFGRSGTNLLPVLEKGAAGFDQMGKVGRDLGIIMSKEQVEAAALLGNQLKILTEAGRVLVAEGLMKIQEALPSIIEYFFEFVKAIAAGRQGINDLITDVTAVSKVLLLLATATSTYNLAQAAMGSKEAQDRIKALGGAFTQFSTDVKSGHDANAAAFKDQAILIDGMKTKTQAAIQTIKDMAGTTKDAAKTAQESIDPWNGLMDAQAKAQHNFELTGDTASYLKQNLKDAEKALAEYVARLPAASQLTDEQKKSLDELKNSVKDAQHAHESYNSTMSEAKKQSDEFNKMLQEGKNLAEKAGFDIPEAQLADIAEEAQNAGKSMSEMFKEMQEARDQTLLGGLSDALTDMQKKVTNMKSLFTSFFNSIESDMSKAFENMLEKGGKWTDVMKGFFDDLKKSFFKMISDMLAREIMSSIFGGVGVGGGAGSSVSPLGSGGGGSSISSLLGGGGLLGSLFGGSSGLSEGASEGGGALGGTGLGGIGLGIGGAAIGGSIAAQGISGGNVTQGTLGGALGGLALGATIGSVVPVVGTVIGAVVGAIAGGLAGFFSASRKKKKKQAAARAAAAAAAALAAAQNAEAEQIIKANIRQSFGGGNALTGQVDAISGLLSNDVDPGELAQFGGAQAIIAAASAQQQAAANQAVTNNKSVTVGAPVINVSVGSIGNSYDTQALAQDLGYHLVNTIQAAGAGA